MGTRFLKFGRSAPLRAAPIRPAPPRPLAMRCLGSICLSLRLCPPPPGAALWMAGCSTSGAPQVLTTRARGQDLPDHAAGRCDERHVDGARPAVAAPRAALGLAVGRGASERADTCTTGVRAPVRMLCAARPPASLRARRGGRVRCSARATCLVPPAGSFVQHAIDKYLLRASYVRVAEQTGSAGALPPTQLLRRPSHAAAGGGRRHEEPNVVCVRRRPPVTSTRGLAQP